MNVRAQAVGMASQTQNVANAIFQQFFPIFLKNCGFYAFYMFAGINFLLAVFVFFFIPETKKVSLEEIDALFGGSNHVTQGEMLVAHDKENQLEARDEKADSVRIEDVQSKRWIFYAIGIIAMLGLVYSVRNACFAAKYNSFLRDGICAISGIAQILFCSSILTTKD